ncbi:hypothetical protein VIBNIAM115_1260002 [Vibrio nigripulchritudo AM115]|nr:hypothetical protein VIBNIAM115_1260002 [Vibrio nigripulchritudo AM115]
MILLITRSGRIKNERMIPGWWARLDDVSGSSLSNGDDSAKHIKIKEQFRTRIKNV